MTIDGVFQNREELIQFLLNRYPGYNLKFDFNPTQDEALKSGNLGDSLIIKVFGVEVHEANFLKVEEANIVVNAGYFIKEK